MRALAALVAAGVLAAGCGDGAERDEASPPTADGAATATTITLPEAATPAAPPTTTAPTTTSDPRGGGAVTYRFPVEPATSASYGRTHAIYPATDVFAPCGTTLVAMTDGVVDELSRVDRWNPGRDDPALRGGLFVSLVGDDGVRYYTSHLMEVDAGLEPGTGVAAGRRIGRIGRSGNARSKPCHVHIGFSPPRGPGDWQVRRGVVFPWPYLDAWRSGAQRSPRHEVEVWARANPL